MKLADQIQSQYCQKQSERNIREVMSRIYQNEISAQRRKE